MSYTNYTASDFICDDSFLRYYLNEDDNDVIFWQHWINNHPEKSNEVKEAIRMLEVLSLNLPQSEFEQELIKMKEHVYDSAPITEPKTLRITPSQPEPKRRWVRSLWGIVAVSMTAAAITAVVFLIGNGDHLEPEHSVSNQLITKRNSNGQKSDLHLSDGSRVFLNSGSEIQFFENFAKNNREVKLKGEAYFEVAHDPKKPFIVVTDKLSVRALGTSFNVKAFGETNDVAVSLVEGKVEVSLSENVNEEKSVLTPGEGLVFNGNDLSIKKLQFDPAMTLAWKSGILKFKDASWNEIENTLTRWYGVEFTIHHAPKRESPFTGEFDNLSLQLVLESLSFTKSFDYQIQGKKVEIKFTNQLKERNEQDE